MYGMKKEVNYDPKSGDDMHPNHQTNSLVLVRNRYLNEEEFQRFLSLARSVATYDPGQKVWVFSRKKIISAAERGILKQILDELQNYAQFNRRAVEALLAHKKVKELEAKIYFNPLSIQFSAHPPEPLVQALLPYVSRQEDKVLYISATRHLKDAIRVLENFEVTVHLPAPIDEIFKAKITRENGNLYVRFSFIPRDVLEELRAACTLIYRIEKPVLSSSGDFEGVKIIERKIKAYNVIWREKAFVAPVGLLDRVTSTLRNNCYNVEIDIKVLPDLEISLKPDFVLRPHQLEAFKKWNEKKRGTIAIFTRGGKSFIALKAIESLRKPAIIFVTTRELIATWIEYLERFLGVSSRFIGVVGAGKREIKGITVATYASAVKYIDNFRGRFELAIFDEAHHVPAITFKNVALKIDSLYRMALSATPKRRDGNEELLYALCGDLVFNMGYKELLELRLVAPIEKFETIFVNGEHEKLEKLVEILRENRGSKIIVFTQLLETAKKVYNRLLLEGFNPLLLTGQVSGSKRKLAFQEFKRRKTAVMVTTTVLDEGITVPDADMAIIYEGSGEARQMIQRIGRVLGYALCKTAKIFELIDASNPKERSAYYRRKWIKKLYLFPGLEKYVEEAKSCKEVKVDEGIMKYLEFMD